MKQIKPNKSKRFRLMGYVFLAMEVALIVAFFVWMFWG